jgi:hypothetical protein
MMTTRQGHTDLGVYLRHASISAEKRAERGLPENLIRLCVGIEDPRDLIDDLEHSLLESGAIYQRFDIDSEPATPTTSSAPSGNRDLYVSEPERWIVERAGRFARSGMTGQGHSLGEDSKSTVQSLVDDVKTKLGFSGPEGKQGEETETGSRSAAAPGSSTDQDQDILVSAPGKVILFGEHAVVHGVVR